MAAGKTTIGSRLAAEFGLDFVDCDKEIEIAVGKSIAGIFAEAGEAAFRKIESKVFAEILRLHSGASLVSCGGGLILNPENRGRLMKHKIVFLDTHFSIIENRLRNDRGERPLLRNIKPEQLKALYETRRKKYLEYSHFVVNNTEEFKDLLEKLIAQEKADET